MRLLAAIWPPQSLASISNVQYGPRARHVLDIYRPSGATTLPTVPLVLHVHGGDWQRGSKNDRWRGAPVAGEAYARSGCVAVVISYRLAPPSTFSCLFRAFIFALVLSALVTLVAWPFRWLAAISFATLFSAYVLPCTLVASFAHKAVTHCSDAYSRHPHQADDIALAVQWCRDHIGEYAPEVLHTAETVPRGLVLSGHSAGAHLTALLISDGQYLADIQVDPAFVRGVVAISGVYSLTGPLADRQRACNALFRCTYGASAVGSSCSRKTLVDASPLQHVHSRLPAFLILSAQSDFGLEADAERFVRALAAAGVEHEYHTIAGTDHATIANKFDRNGALDVVVPFVRRVTQCSRVS